MIEIVINAIGPTPCDITRVGRVVIESRKIFPRGPVSHGWIYIEDMTEKGRFVAVRGSLIGCSDDTMSDLSRILDHVKEVTESAGRFNSAAA